MAAQKPIASEGGSQACQGVGIADLVEPRERRAQIRKLDRKAIEPGLLPGSTARPGLGHLRQRQEPRRMRVPSRRFLTTRDQTLLRELPDGLQHPKARLVVAAFLA